MKTLSKDNKFGSMVNNTQYEKRTVNISTEDLEYYIRKYFKWRKGDMISRLYKQGSSKYDNFINYLIDKGY